MLLPFRCAGLALAALLAPSVHAENLAEVCHASSSYDLTVKPDGLLFDRAQPAPFHVVMHDGSLRTDGARVALNAENQDRIALFERELRQLLPRARTVAQQGVELAADALHQEGASLHLAPATMSELDRRVAGRATELKQRIATSNSTHDWQGDAMNGYLDQVAADLLPLLAADLGQQALDAAMRGDLQGAAGLRDRAAALPEELRTRIGQRLDTLRPRVQALCPAIQRLAELQQGVPAASGKPLRLLQLAQ